MSYSRKELDKLSNPRENNQEESEVMYSHLLSKLHTDEEMTITEKITVGSILPLLHSSEDNSTLDLYNYPKIEDAHFLNVHSTYFKNLNGHYPQFDWRGEIDKNQVKKDIELLNRHYEGWKEELKKTDQKDELLIQALSETRTQLKDLKKYQDKERIGSNLAEYQRKSTILFSKKAYFLVKEYYEYKSKNFTEFEVNSELVRVDGFGYYHTLTRHYSALSRDHLFNKDFHIANLNHRYLPDNVEVILKEFNKMGNKEHFNKEHLMFSIGGKPYSIRFKEMTKNIKGGGQISYYRFQTIYPISDPQELEKFNSAHRLDFEPFESEFNKLKDS